MINNYIQENYEEILRKVKGVTRHHHLTEDLLQDCILNFLEKGPDYISKVLRDNKVQHYLVRMVYIQFNSKTSPFYMKYRKASRKSQNIDDYNIELPEDKKEEKVDSQKLVDDIKIYIGNLPLYEKTISQRFYFDNTSQRNMSKEYGINRIHIAKGINNVTKNIKLNFNKDDYKTE
jgi:DNA-directed RNA polymerase specialized sigma subunit